MKIEDLKKGNELQDEKEKLMENLASVERNGIKPRMSLDCITKDITFNKMFEELSVNAIEIIKSKILKIDEEFEELGNIFTIGKVPAGSTLTGITINTVDSDGATVDIDMDSNNPITKAFNKSKLKVISEEDKSDFDNLLYCTSKNCAATYKKYIKGFLTQYQSVNSFPASQIAAEAQKFDEAQLEVILRNLKEQEEGYKKLQKENKEISKKLNNAINIRINFANNYNRLTTKYKESRETALKREKKIVDLRKQIEGLDIHILKYKEYPAEIAALKEEIGLLKEKEADLLEEKVQFKKEIHILNTQLSEEKPEFDLQEENQTGVDVRAYEKRIAELITATDETRDKKPLKTLDPKDFVQTKTQLELEGLRLENEGTRLNNEIKQAEVNSYK